MDCSTHNIRQQFLQYFARHQHEIVSRNSLIPHNDPTLLFTNAGMNQFKDVFLGQDKRPYSRATTAQLCVRAGGKHNDLENVGYTARHHTLFEMLGNFSFGDYFKKQAIEYAWGFLTDVLKIPAEKLWVTIYQDDEETADLWLKHMKINPERFSRCGEKDNFWTMGDIGPCGPCTEIFYDHGPEIPGGPPGSPDEDGDRYIEIWNLVFMQYNRDASGKLTPLPRPSVDTGMGLERLAAVLQGVHTNYDIDLFQTIIQTILKLFPNADPHQPSVKVLADHIRSCSFLINDGVIPSNEGRGYVLRRIIRRAVRHGFHLGTQEPFFHALVPALIKAMGDAYPELRQSQTMIEKILKQEELQFAKTLDQGMSLLEKAVAELSSPQIPGDLIFKLYDTYGFPVDLTGDIARERNLSLDLTGFEAEMEKQRQQSQQASKFSTVAINVDTAQATEFTGYAQLQHNAVIQHIMVEGQPVEKISPGQEALIVLDQTPFYAESGGQIGDQGVIQSNTALFKVHDTQKHFQLHMHHGVLEQGSLTVGETILAQVEGEKRRATMLNHSATHLLHAALRKLLGEHVLQRGSLVEPERLRFDFTHFEPISAAQLTAIEVLVNEEIRANHVVQTDVMDMDAAKQSGAIALFGEKYSDQVRVLAMGDFSKELCGGTHVKRTGDIGLFKIISESGIASGVRRIEAITGDTALQWIQQTQASLNQVATLLTCHPFECAEKLNQWLEQKKTQEQRLQTLESKYLVHYAEELRSHAKKIGDHTVLITEVQSIESKQLRDLVDQLKNKLKSAAIFLALRQQEQISLVAGVTSDLVQRVHAGKWVQEIAQLLGGKGGGRADFAQAGANKSEQLPQALQQAYTLVEKLLK